MGVVPIDVVNSIAGETGLPGKVVGKVDIRERHAFVDVASEHANAILAKLNRAEIKGHKVKIKRRDCLRFARNSLAFPARERIHVPRQPRENYL